MPKKEFIDCMKAGGKMVRKQLKNNRYIDICYDKEGKSHPGDVRVLKKQEEVTSELKVRLAKENKEQASTLTAPTEEQLLSLMEHFNTRRS